MPENWAVLDLEQVKSSRMQDMHGIGEGGGGGMFIGAGDRRLRPLNHQAVKCPRCDSLNTKFCYYNNYNLSQPRYFCKTCRRYWTKGGVLRNVPVGGGCRKTKRSKPKINYDTKSNTIQTSSSDTSSQTTSAAATAPPSDAAKEVSASIYTSSASAVMYNFADASFSNANPQPNPNPDHQPLDNETPADGQIFSSEIGSFTGMMPSSEEMMMGLDIATTSYSLEQPVAENPKAEAELKMEDMRNEAAALDWGSASDGGDQGLFDLTAGVDPAYWSQSDWTDNDQSLNYLP